MNRQADYMEIKQAFTNVVKAWESGRTNELDRWILADVYAKFSIFGEGFLSRETLKRNLETFTKKPEYIRMEVLNFVCLINGNYARQSAGISGIFTNEDGTERYWFTGMAAAVYEKKQSGWKISELRFELLNDSTVKLTRGSEGRLTLVPGKENEFVKNWKPINDRIGWFYGCPLPVVSGEYDAPWLAIRDRENPGTDEEQVQELFYRYCFGLDMDAFYLWNDLFLPDGIVNFKMFGPMDRRKAAAVMKLMRQEVARRTHHMGYFTKLQIVGNQAETEICRVISGEHYAQSLSSEVRAAATVPFYMNAEKLDGQWYIKEIGAR